ncbi:MAG TPA: hypothetical protein VGB53_05195 [Rubricoccaceae bacterium]|jgi:hypothetical protein
MRSLIFLLAIVGFCSGCTAFAQSTSSRTLERFAAESAYRPAHSDSLVGFYRMSTGLGGGSISVYRNGIVKTTSYGDVGTSYSFFLPPPFDYWGADQWGWYAIRSDTLLVRGAGPIGYGTPFSCGTASVNVGAPDAMFRLDRFLIKRTEGQVHLVYSDSTSQHNWAFDLVSRRGEAGRLTTPPGGYVRDGIGTLSDSLFDWRTVAPVPCNAQQGLELEFRLTEFPRGDGVPQGDGCREVGGVITDVVTGAPLAGVEVRTDFCGREVITGADGSFRSNFATREGLYHLVFYRPDYRLVRVFGRGDSYRTWQH